MDKIDTLNTAFQHQLDSLSIFYNEKIDGLIKISERSQVSQEYFSDILSHQWTLLSMQTGIFTTVIFVILGLMGFISWRYFFRQIPERLEKVESVLEQVEILRTSLNALEKKLEATNRNALRSLYEGTEGVAWKVIWHIRYADTFDLNGKGLQSRLRKLQKEMEQLKKDEAKYKFVGSFESINGLRKILQKITQSKEPETSAMAAQILADLQSAPK